MTNSYIYSSELFCLLLSFFILFLMLYTHPQRTVQFHLNLTGIIFSIVAISAEMAIGIAATYCANDQLSVGIGFFNVLSIIFLICYLCDLWMIVIYIKQLAKTQHRAKKAIVVANSLVLVAAIGLGISHTLTGKFYYLDGNHLIFTYFVQFYVVIGMVGAVFAFVSSLINKKDLPHTVFVFIMIFTPLDFAILLAQLFNPTHIFTAITYVFPFVIFYILFHSNPYDVITGTQNRDAFENRFQSFCGTRRKYMIMFVMFPELAAVDYTKLSKKQTKMQMLFAETCRKVEQQHRNIFIYHLERASFAVIYKYRKVEQAEEAAYQIKAIVSHAAEKVDANIYPRCFALHNDKRLDSVQAMSFMIDYLEKKQKTEGSTQLLLATEEDYEKALKLYHVEQTLLDIRKKDDLNDPRVLVYAQPIYSVEEDRFKTAEALMRLQIDGQIIYPDNFIPLAESNNCIHALTRIILNKVCCQIAQMEAGYDFDAITVNCSSSEFSDRRLYDEIMDIIIHNHVNPEHIRIELTESAIFENYEVVQKNMKLLNQKGVKLYLDDFGTGYSNFERIMGSPFHTIKFDKSLLYKALEDEDMGTIMSQMVHMFKEKGFTALVEGVEDDAQSQFSVASGFNYIQGYKYAKPQPIEKLTEYFTARP